MWKKKAQFEYARNTKTGSEHLKTCKHGATLAGICHVLNPTVFTDICTSKHRFFTRTNQRFYYVWKVLPLLCQVTVTGICQVPKCERNNLAPSKVSYVIWMRYPSFCRRRRAASTPSLSWYRRKAFQEVGSCDARCHWTQPQTSEAKLGYIRRCNLHRAFRHYLKLWKLSYL